MEIGDSPVDMMVGFSHYDAGFCRHFAHSRSRIPADWISRRAMDPRMQRRFEGYRDAMKAASLFDPSLVVTTRYRPPSRLAGRCSRSLWRRAPDIEAVFCVNDDLALGVLFECQRRQLSVPGRSGHRRLQRPGVHGLRRPSLTSVRTNRYEMGRHAVTMVIDAIEGRRRGAGPRPRLSTHDLRKLDAANRVTAKLAELHAAQLRK